MIRRKRILLVEIFRLRSLRLLVCYRWVGFRALLSRGLRRPFIMIMISFEVRVCGQENTIFLLTSLRVIYGSSSLSL